MAMRMLAAGGMSLMTDGERGADGSNPHGYFELEQVKTLDKAGPTGWLAEARGQGVKVISFLLTYLPEDYDYQVIFMHRHLDEVLASQNAMLDARAEARGPEDDRARTLYAGHLQQVARFMAKRPCFAVCDVDYQDVVADPARQSARINAFLGGHLDEARMVEAVDPALYRNRGPAP
jgi:hypothetical protein